MVLRRRLLLLPWLCLACSLPSRTLVFEDVPVAAGDDCVTDCPVDRALVQSQRLDAISFRPCEPSP